MGVGGQSHPPPPPNNRFTRKGRAAVPIELEGWMVPRARVDVLESLKLSFARIRL
jgi:hypothetical protein